MKNDIILNPENLKGFHHSEISKYSSSVIRETRKIRGVSQEVIGKVSGYSFQQQQKYEKGTNFIRAGNLFLQACYLGIPISSCFPKQIFKSNDETTYHFLKKNNTHLEINVDSIEKERKIYQVYLMLSLIENESDISSIYNETSRLFLGS